jgi:hypothetical protein
MDSIYVIKEQLVYTQRATVSLTVRQHVMKVSEELQDSAAFSALVTNRLQVNYYRFSLSHCFE